MALSNAQYDAMMRAYEERRVRNRHIVKERREKVYGRIPELKAIDSWWRILQRSRQRGTSWASRMHRLGFMLN